jgi:L-ornithine N5-oxygenase
MTTTAPEFDFLGIGFGPANLAIAVAMDERPAGRSMPAYGFIEKKPEFVWHGGMLLENSSMQISFLKDLVTLRNPTSRFTFVNYLHDKARLEDFVNLKTFFPTRTEYNDYLGWVAHHFEDRCHYGEEVFSIEPQMQGGTVRSLRVKARNEEGEVSERVCRNLVVGIGGAPLIPSAFAGLNDARVLHSSAYLKQIDSCLKHNSKRQRVAVIGGGQSAAEVFCDLSKRYSNADVSLIMRGNALKPSDDSPFVNEIFSPRFTDVIYRQPQAQRQRLLDEFRNTNYAVVDLDLIEKIYELLYLQKVSGIHKHELLSAKEIEQVDAGSDGIDILLRDRTSGEPQTRRFDIVVLATGYRRDGHRKLLAGLNDYIEDFTVDRHYRLKTTDNFLPAIHLQGCCEDSHGLSDTLLSVLAVRSQEVVDAIMQRLPAHHTQSMLPPLQRSIAAPAGMSGEAVSNSRFL